MSQNAAKITASITQASNESNPSRVEKFRITLQVIGIKKRCRKSERHFFHFGHMPYNNGQYDQEALKSQVIDWINTNMKEVHSVIRVSLDYVVIKNEDGYTVTEWEPFGPNHVKFDINLYK